MFGSFARGDPRPTSDVDVLIVGEPSQDALAERISDVEQHIGREINFVTYRRDEMNRLIKAGDAFVGNAMAEGRRVKGTEPA